MYLYFSLLSYILLGHWQTLDAFAVYMMYNLYFSHSIPDDINVSLLSRNECCHR